LNTFLLLQLFNQVTFNQPGLGAIISAVLIVLLLMVSGTVSASEIAFFSLSPVEMNKLEEGRTDTDKGILALRKDSERTLATILITNNFVNVTIIMLCNYFFEKIVNFGDNFWLQFFVVTVLLTFLLLLFGEIMPKIYSSQHPLEFCRKSYSFILLIEKLIWPIASLLLYSRPLAAKIVQKDSRVLSVDELEQALELTNKSELKEEQSMLKGIIRFGDETVKEVMTSRQDVVDLEIKISFVDVLKCIVENNYSRIPVYQDNIDNIKGILYIKDLLPHLSKSSNFRWQSLIRPPYFVPETKKIDDLLREFQQNKVHIAVVVDEFGGTSGIVTLEDILEEIVGEINDEYDEEEKNYVRLSKNAYLFEGKTLLSDFYKILKIDEEEFASVEGEADTLAGLLLEIKGDFPKSNEIITFKKYSFEVTEVDERRILKIKLIIRNEINSSSDPVKISDDA
jgi:putative hemolysin